MIYQYEIWIADLNPQTGAETGKIRPVVILQTDILNEIGHPSTIICPITTNLQNSQLLRLRLNSEVNQLDKISDILIDQIRAIDNKRLIKKIGKITDNQISTLKTNLKIILELNDLH